MASGFVGGCPSLIKAEHSHPEYSQPHPLSDHFDEWHFNTKSESAAVIRPGHAAGASSTSSASTPDPGAGRGSVGGPLTRGRAEAPAWRGSWCRCTRRCSPTCTPRRKSPWVTGTAAPADSCAPWLSSGTTFRTLGSPPSLCKGVLSVYRQRYWGPRGGALGQKSWERGQGTLVPKAPEAQQGGHSRLILGLRAGR